MTVGSVAVHSQRVMSVRQALRWAVPVLVSAGVGSPRLDAEVLLADVLSWERARLYAWPEQVLTADQRQAFGAAVERRRLHEPVPYIVGQRSFYGLDFAVDRRVLIPRPATELLVTKSLEVATRIAVAEPRMVLADVGTGSGILAACLALNLPASTVLATDSSVEALQVAAANVHRLGVSDRVHLVHSDLLSFSPKALHVIVANLPYVPIGDIASLARDVRLYEPLPSLDGGSDGLDPVRRLLERSIQWLLPRGAILVEVGADQGARVVRIATQIYPGARIHRFRDYAGLDRVVSVET